MFRPRYLDPGQLKTEYRRSLEAAEIGVLQAHLQKVAAPDAESENAADVALVQAIEAVRKIEDDYEETLDALEELERQAEAEQRQRFPRAMRHRQ